MSGTNDVLLDKNSDKYKVALKFINQILTNLGKEQVDDLTKFADIDREDIIKDVNKKSLDGMAKELFKHFDKKKSSYYRKTDAIVLNCLRNMMKELGCEFTYEQKEVYELVNNKSFRKTCMLYTIK